MPIRARVARQTSVSTSGERPSWRPWGRAAQPSALRYLSARDTISASYTGDARRGIRIAALVVGAVLVLVGGFSLLTVLLR